MLAKVDPDAREADVDRPMYYTLRGIIALKKKNYETAIQHFDEAIRYGQTDESIFIHLAQAHYGLKQWQKVVQMVRNADETGRDIPDLFLMKAESQRQLDRRSAAWQTLVEGRRRFDDNRAFHRQQVFLLVEMGLYREAMRRGRAYLKRGDQTAPDDYIAVAEAFRRAGEHDRAQILLERARFEHPEHTKLTVHLAHSYIGGGELIAGAELLQVAAESDPTHLGEAAEVFRRAGAYERALYLNSRVRNQTKKLEQRVAILLDQKTFGRIAALESRLSRLGLLSDQKIVYALTYAHFEVRNFERAQALTRRIESRDLFDSAVQLRRAIETCRKTP
ncbi:MAG: tetratricopeptide repeat protein, partial [Bradymonadaceae bacterium]